MNHHIHVYEVLGVQEFNVEADTPEQAKEYALMRAQVGRWDVGRGCRMIAIEPDAPFSEPT